jgi:pectate lyase
MTKIRENKTLLWNQRIWFAVSTVAVVLSAFRLHAQDACVSFGWANYDGQSEKGAVTGGGNGTPVNVTTFAALKSAVESSDAKVIYIMNDVGDGYKGKSGDVLMFKSNKTLIGVKPGITIKCSFQIKSVNNIIIKNLICRGPGNSNSEQNWDAVNIEGSKRIWFDHCTVMEGEDGNFDVVKGSDNVTASWCKFTYVTSSTHNLSNLIGSSDDETESHGKLNVTFAYCWWENPQSRCPRTRYGKIHVLNCYYKSIDDGAFAGYMSNMRVEGCYFESDVKNPVGLISTGGQAGVFVIDCNKGQTMTDGYSTVFTPPYQFKKYANSEVKSMVTNSDTGAGPTLTSPTNCGLSTDIASEIHEKKNKISSIPSIVSDKMVVNLNLKQGDEIWMSVLNLNGRKIIDMKSISQNNGVTTSTLDLKNVKSGVYIFKLNTSSQSITQKIIKK